MKNLYNKLVENDQNSIEMSAQKLPNFFDSLQEHDIEDFLQDIDDFKEYGVSYHTDRQVSYLKIELEEREAGINKRVDVDVLSRSGSISARKVVNQYIKQNTTLYKEQKRHEIVGKKFLMVGDPCY